MLEVWLGVAVVLVLLGAGYWAGYRQGARNTAQDWSERMLRIDPPRRSAGQPTNLDGEPSRVTKSRIRQERRWGGDNTVQR